MFFDHYPYTNFHNVNLDWVLQAVKSWGLTVEANDQAFKDLKAANESFKEYVTHYLQNLDVSDEINDKLDQMLADGVLDPYFAPYIQTNVTTWLNQHITPTMPVVDSSLTISGAAADSATVGEKIAKIKSNFLKYNAVDLTTLWGNYTSDTSQGISYTFSNDNKTCTATGTASGPSRKYIYNNSQALPEGIAAGSEYYVKCASSNVYLYLYFTFYDENGATLAAPLSVGRDKTITVPAAAHGMSIAIAVSNGRTVNSDTITFALVNAESNSELAGMIAKTDNNLRVGAAGSVYPDEIIQGSYNSRGEVVANPARIRTNDFIRTYQGEQLIFAGGQQTKEMLVGFFNTDKTFLRDGDWIAESGIVDLTDGYIICVFRTSSEDETITPANYDANAYIKPVWLKDIQKSIDDADGSPIPEYYFADNYLPDKVDEINNISLTLSRQSGRWFFVSDYHLDANANNSPALVRYLAKKCGIKETAFNGDALTRYDSKIEGYNKLCEFMNLFNPVADLTDIYYVTGNHEYNNSDLQHSEYEIPKSALFMLFNAPKKDITCLNNTNSFYLDNDNTKIRYYFIDCEHGALISVATIKSVLESAENIPDGYAVVIFSHTGLTANNSAIIERFALIMGGFAALNDGQDYTYDGTTYTYSSGSSRTFVGAITGHTHLEGYVIYNNRFPVIAVPCDCYMAPQQVSHPERVAGTVLEQAFEVLQIDVTAKRIYLTRVGWGNSRIFSFGEGAGLIS